MCVCCFALSLCGFIYNFLQRHFARPLPKSRILRTRKLPMELYPFCQICCKRPKRYWWLQADPAQSWNLIYSKRDIIVSHTHTVLYDVYLVGNYSIKTKWLIAFGRPFDRERVQKCQSIPHLRFRAFEHDVMDPFLVFSLKIKCRPTFQVDKTIAWQVEGRNLFGGNVGHKRVRWSSPEDATWRIIYVP